MNAIPSEDKYREARKITRTLEYYLKCKCDSTQIERIKQVLTDFSSILVY